MKTPECDSVNFHFCSGVSTADRFSKADSILPDSPESSERSPEYIFESDLRSGVSELQEEPSGLNSLEFRAFVCLFRSHASQKCVCLSWF